MSFAILSKIHNSFNFLHKKQQNMENVSSKIEVSNIAFVINV